MNRWRNPVRVKVGRARMHVQMLELMHCIIPFTVYAATGLGSSVSYCIRLVYIAVAYYTQAVQHNCHQYMKQNMVCHLQDIQVWSSSYTFLGVSVN